MLGEERVVAGACEQLMFLRKVLWEWTPKTLRPAEKCSPHKAIWGPRVRRRLPQSSSLDRAQQLVAAVVDLLAGLIQVHSFLSKTLLSRGGSESTVGAKESPTSPFVGDPHLSNQSTQQARIRAK